LIIWNLLKDKILNNERLLGMLVLVNLAIGVFGWAQYLQIPDMTSM